MDECGGVKLHAATCKTKHGAGRLNRPSTDLFCPLGGSSRRAETQSVEAVSDTAAPFRHRGIWARARRCRGSRVHPRLQPKEKPVL